MRPARAGSLRRHALRLEPGSFSMIMATGIVAAGLREDGQPVAGGVVLGMAAAAFAVLTVATFWRSGATPATARADLSAPDRAFTAFTFTAACGVLGLGLVTVGWPVAGAVLAVAGAAAWLGLTVLIPVRMAIAHHGRPAIADVNGTWYLWTVATQSLAIMAAFLPAAGLLSLAAARAAAVGFLLAGLAIYVLTTALVTARLRRAGAGPPGGRAAYWVAMGAVSISVLAAAQILRLAGGSPQPWITRTALVLWVAATALIPVLVVATAAVWLRSRRRLRYQSAAWMVVFPLGMYAVASHQLGIAASLTTVRVVGESFVWPAGAAWLAVLAMLAAAPLLRAGHRRPAAAAPPRSMPSVVRERWPRAGRNPLPHPEGRMTRKYQAVVSPMPRPGTGHGQAVRPCADTRAVIRAHDHSTHYGRLLTALVTADDGSRQGADCDLIATMVVVGPHLDQCLGIGDAFTIWRGTDIGLGVITRRLFV